MKLYVWENPYEIIHGRSTLIAIADTLKEAEALAKRAGDIRQDAKIDSKPLMFNLPCAYWVIADDNPHYGNRE
jgi:hypothetical protein